jgi:hydroxymethylglutaryl-CoA reductase (NADPH)
MVGKATKAACDWIVSIYEGIERYQLEGSFATDKKTSWVNTLHTRGKKVIAEATIPAQKLKEIMHVTVEQIFEARLASQLGGFLAGVNNNGAHSANGITAMFIACGQMSLTSPKVRRRRFTRKSQSLAIIIFQLRFPL